MKSLGERAKGAVIGLGLTALALGGCTEYGKAYGNRLMEDAVAGAVIGYVGSAASESGRRAGGGGDLGTNVNVYNDSQREPEIGVYSERFGGVVTDTAVLSNGQRVYRVEQKTAAVPSRYEVGDYVATIKDIEVKQGPGNDRVTIMNYGRNFPVLVESESRNGWILVRDYEGDRGWIEQGFVVPNDFAVTRAKTTFFKEPSNSAEIEFTADKGVLFEVLDYENRWIALGHEDGYVGWTQKINVWGAE